MRQSLSVLAATLVVTGFVASARGQLSATLFEENFNNRTVGADLKTIGWSEAFAESGTISVSALDLGDGNSAQRTVGGNFPYHLTSFNSTTLGAGEFFRLSATMLFTGTQSAGSIRLLNSAGSGGDGSGWGLFGEFSGPESSFKAVQISHFANANTTGNTINEGALVGTPFDVQLEVFPDGSARGYYRLTSGVGSFTEIPGGARAKQGGDDLGTADGILLAPATNDPNIWGFDNIKLEHVGIPEPATLMLFGLALPLLARRRR